MDMGAPEPIERAAFSGNGGRDAAPRGWLSPVNLAILLGALVAASLVVILIFQASASNRQRDAALERERHSYDVMLVTRSAGASMARAEAALGRFATSADRGMGTSYYNNWTDAGAQISQLEGLVGTDPEEVALVRKLRTLYDARGLELGLTAQRAYYRQGWPALLLFNNAGHSKLIAQIDRTLSAIQDHESSKLQSRFNQSDAAALQSNHLGQLLSVTGLLLAAAAGVLAWLALLGLVTQRRARAEAEAADDRASWLEHAVAERTHELREANDRLHSEMVEREAAESRLRQMQKMEAVGQLTGGIAHDFNNMLAVVVGGLDLARRRLESEAEEVGRHIDNAMEGANRAAALTRRLLGFARAEPLLPEAVDPGQLIDGMSDLIDRTLGERVIVTTRIAPESWPVWVDPMQLENAIINLAVNARDAMNGAGTLEIAVDNAVLADGEVGQAKAGDHVRVAVTDNGCGMTPQVLERVFEPFFTTKEVGKGTGLGMSQIFGFVRQSGGDIAIRSAPGEGTTVSLYLPRGNRLAAAPASPTMLTKPIPPATPPGGAISTAEPVLIVEDDPRVRVATTAAIAELGYRAIACGSGEEALSLLAEHGDVQLMITDVVMPGMTGPELGALVRLRHPHVGILYVTGYAGEAGEGGELEGEAVLRKPFTVSALEKAVGAAMLRLRQADAA
ncbi:ATP-binding protein [Sphingomonas abietis]|uniref:histidine kinase n=1 Tax=Sphingomonas abietis TaxID=3012344 RepID=A0ABY7NM12_9SPHN|nr:ATP-binding protein [Sphingomonas abietis]WBO22010.1 ATP-binding protein [Sphingomonas abietis]